MVILKILLFVLILGLIILVHEAGHFFWAKKFHVHIYEFSIGMGPIIHNHKGKDGIDYNIRAVPIGGFVSMAGEVYEDDETKKIPKKDFMCNKPWYQRVIILVAGVVNNFILALILLFFISLIWGGTTLKPVVKSVVEGSAMENAGVIAGDTITNINGYNIHTWDEAQIVLYMKDSDNVYDFTIKHQDGTIETKAITPNTIKNEETNQDQKVFGVEIVQEKSRNFFNSIGYAFSKFQSIINSMVLTIYGLFSGKISLSALSGPVGIYEVIGESVSAGLFYVIYIIAFLSINVGFINILPFPAFDGGRVFFLIIEKIKGSPVNSKFENTCHMVGFCLLMLLMVYVTYQDVLRFIIK